MSSATLNAPTVPQHPALLLLPRIRVQNANAISSPMTWGFPAMTAFLGLMTALERRLGREAGIAFRAVGVVCHSFEAQVTTEGYTRAFHLTRNPVLADGSTAGIVEEGRVHLELSLVFDVLISADKQGAAERQALVDLVAHTLAGMRLAGGSVMPALPILQARRGKPTLELEAEDDEKKGQQFRKLMRRCLPGFALVSRDDLLRERLAAMQAHAPQASALDAWLDLSRWNHRADPGEDASEGSPCQWQTDARPGWTVPIPVGYAALSDLHPAGSVANARDTRTPFRFVETLWSMGQWLSPHRLKKLDDLLWYTTTEGDAHKVYRCCNDFAPEVLAYLAPTP
jgi:CRISPR-associated protein Csy2